ncbi:MAG TPA: ABC transporter substrate-binding protein [Stellaceae bacterium]|nr:ABC transporter substrate-binding protein [Stellaceae bacterium]
MRRRRILGPKLVLAALIALSPCLAAPSPAAEPSGDIVLMAYPGAFQDNYVKAVVEPFMKAHPGVKVTYNPGGNSAQMLGLLRAQKANPQVDVAIIDFSVSRVGNKEGIFSKLDRKDVPNLADIYDEARMPGDMGPGITFDNLVMLYGPDQVKPAPTGIKDLLDPKNKGKIGFSPAPNVIGIALQIVVAKAIGVGYKAPIDPVIAELKKIAQNVQTWQATPDNYTMIINGALALGIGWNARAQFYADKSGGKVKSIVMQEGGILDMDTINLVAGSRNPAAALAFIDYALGPEPQKRMAEAMYYGPTNKKAVLPPELMARTSSAPATLAKMIPVDWDYVASVQDQWTERWRREVIPAQ